VPFGESPSTTLVDAADRALYRAKAAGRNCVRVSGDEEAGAAAGAPQS